MTDKSMKKALRIVFQVLVNVIIVLLVIQIFSVAYNFFYKVFTDNSLNPMSRQEIEFVIKPDTSTVEVVDSLVEAGVIQDKYVMIAKIYLSSYHGKIMPGTYTLSPAMTQDEIMKEITGNNEEEESE